MVSKGERRQWTWIAGLWMGSLAAGGCFVGEAATGLPCSSASDCGIGEACALDPAKDVLCCGGVCGNEVNSPTSSSSSSTDATMDSSSSTVGMTTEVSSSTSGEPLCGNGELDEGEECDNPLNSNCDPSCQYLDACGDGVREAGEACDVWGHPSRNFESCSEDCNELTLLHWDLDGDKDDALRDICPDGGCKRWIHVGLGPNDPRVSGEYYDGGALPKDGSWPEAVLLTRSFTVPQLDEGQAVVVTIDHTYAIDADTERNQGRAEITRSDYGIVSLIPVRSDVPADVATWVRVIPRANDEPDAYPIDCDGVASSCFGKLPIDPFCDSQPLGRGISGERGSSTNPATTVARFENADLDALEGQTFVLSFRLRYDCDNFGPLGPLGWEIHGFDVRVVDSTGD